MRINADFGARILVHSEKLDWIESPLPGVFRRPLDRVGTEVARATSVVKYDPGCSFSPHVHTGGEEFLVLEGVFQDEHGNFPAGSYIRNPPQSRHTPRSEPGCIIFVKLWQFRTDDDIHVRLNENFMQAVPIRGKEGVSITPLYRDRHEDVCIETWQANIEIEYQLSGGAELFVLGGSFVENGETLLKHSWLRLPVDSTIKIKNGDKPSKVWIKRGHLVHASEEIARLPIN